MGSALQFLAIIAIATWLASRGAGAVAKGVLGLVLLCKDRAERDRIAAGEAA